LNSSIHTHVEELEPGRKYAAFFAIRLLTCPSARAGENSLYAPEQILTRHLAEHADFINALFRSRSEVVYALRFISRPNPRAMVAGSIQIALLVRVDAGTEALARTRSREIWSQMTALLAGYFPAWQWQSVQDEAGFAALWQPFDLMTAQTAEIRRREDRVHLDRLQPRPWLGRGRKPGPVSQEDAASQIYFVHPFLPRSTSLARLLRIMLLQTRPLLWQVTLNPTYLSAPEERAFIAEMRKCERHLIAEGARTGLPEEEDIIHRRMAREILESAQGQLMRLQDAPFFMAITIAAEKGIPPEAIEALGVEITGPVGAPAVESQPGSNLQINLGGYDIIHPSGEAEAVEARANLLHLEGRPWGATLAPEPLKRLRYLVDAREAAGAFRLPVASAEGMPGLAVVNLRTLPLPGEVAAVSTDKKRRKSLLGENVYLGLHHPVYMQESDRRQHLYVAGQTGTGKTTLLKSMILEGMEKGEGMAVIDPHGDLYQELCGMIPEKRIKDVVLFDPTDMEHPVGLNMLECGSVEERYFAVREMKAIIRRLLYDEFGRSSSDFAGPVFYQYMQMNMLLAMSDPDDPGTLVEFCEILQRGDYYKRWLPLKWSDRRLERWVEEHLSVGRFTASTRGESSMGEWVSSKFEDFIFDPMLRLIFGQKRSTINLREIMDSGKILLVNLAKGRLTEANAHFLGMILLARIQAAAMGRVELPAAQRRFFTLYVDEFQTMATENFTLLLSEARKFGVGLVLANQFISQIQDPRIMQAIFGNVGTLITFRVSYEDAKEHLQPMYLPYFSDQDLTTVPNWHAFVKTTVAGQVVPPFVIRTVLPEAARDAAVAEAVRVNSRALYSRPRAEVEAEIERSLSWQPQPESHQTPE